MGKMERRAIIVASSTRSLQAAPHVSHALVNSASRRAHTIDASDSGDAEDRAAAKIGVRPTG